VTPANAPVRFSRVENYGMMNAKQAMSKVMNILRKTILFLGSFNLFMLSIMGKNYKGYENTRLMA
jgi:hypothetical protein